MQAVGEFASEVEIGNAVHVLVEVPVFEGLLFDLVGGFGKGNSAVEILPWIRPYVASAFR